MKRVLLFAAIVLSCVTCLHAQDIGTVILTMPSGVIGGLDTVTKDKLISNQEDTVAIVVERGEFGSAKRLAFSPDYIEVQTSDVGTTQIKLLSLINDTKIICVVKTVCAKVCDSQIQFYTTNWIPIPQSGLLPDLNKEWFIKADVDKDNTHFQNAYIALDMTPMKIRLYPDNTNMEIHYEIDNYLSAEDYKEIESYLIKEPKILTWDKASFK